VRSFVLGVDIGGTFTDLLLVDTISGTFRVAKVATTPGDQSVGFMDGLAALGIAIDEIATIVHGTTIGTNAILERKGVRCGLITTRGFRDVLELGRRTRPNAYGMIGSFEPLIPRPLRMEVSERIGADGTILVPLDEEEVSVAVGHLLARGAEALVIHFLHAYINPVHERRCAAIARQLWPNPYVSVGSQILPEFREFERGTTAALNAYIQPIMSRYIERLNDTLAGKGFGSELLVMQGNGGMMSASVAARYAVHTVLSGPAAGVIAAAETAGAAGYGNVIACDMGGTSFDVGLIRDGQPSVTTEKDIRYAVPLRVSMIDIHTIGAGGGSIARVNAAGILQVGPESAGAVPGPICYGQGGRQVTVTDANLLLGRINPVGMVGSWTDVSLERVRTAMEEQIGRSLGLDGEQSAAAILAVANNHLAGAIRLVSIEKGHDPRDFVLFAFGGAGPLHAVALARELGIPRVLVPRFPGITSALGCVLADVRHDFVQTINRPVREVSGDEIDRALREQVQRGRDLIQREGVTVERIDEVFTADLLYQGQTHVFRIPIESPGSRPDAVLAQFAARYRDRFDVELSEMHALLINLRTSVIGRRSRQDLRLVAPPVQADGNRSSVGRRRVSFDGAWLETAIYQRDGLTAGDRIAGPAIVKQLDTTVIIDPGATALVDAWGNMVVSV
jgi:N-methylhydantoinase A